MTALRQQLGLGEEHIVCLFAGTIGHVSGADVILDAADRLRALKHIRFLFVGEGPLLPQLKESVARRGLSNVLFHGFQPRERLSEVQSTSDISLVTLKKGKGTHSVPSKVLGYMTAGRPVVASVDKDSETARQIRSAECGLVVPAEDSPALVYSIRSLADDEAARNRLGRNGRLYVENELAMDRVLERYAQVLENVAIAGAGACVGHTRNTL
jgi:colanic acid biosynthesis glycosyl transferase WcaI